MVEKRTLNENKKRKSKNNDNDSGVQSKGDSEEDGDSGIVIGKAPRPRRVCRVKETAGNRANIGGTIIGAPIVSQ